MKRLKKLWRWARFRWRLWREPDPLKREMMRLGEAMHASMMQIGESLSGPMTEMASGLAEWCKDNKELLEKMNDE